MEWTAYWTKLLADNKLVDKVTELDTYERDVLGKEPRTEQICKGIYNFYDEEAKKLTDVKQNCMRLLDEKIDGIHLSSGRVKTRESLLCKVISKRSDNIAAFDNKYYDIDEFNYSNIITDLVGLRLIINYRGRWLMIHRQILELFPFVQEELYQEKELLEHHLGERFQAEWPTVYYARGDSIQEYLDEGLKTKMKKTRYRGIHYILSYQNTYIEL